MKIQVNQIEGKSLATGAKQNKVYTITGNFGGEITNRRNEMATATEIIIQVSERFLNDGTLPYMITDAVSDIRNAPELAGREIEIRSYIMSYGNAMIDIKVTGIENQLTQLIIEDKARKLLPLRRNWRSLTRHVTVLK